MGIQLDCLRALPGYKVSVLASGLPKARHMVMGTVATLFVGSTAGNILALAMSGSADPRMETFLTRFLPGRSDWGRLEDVLTMRDGSVLVSDDLNGAIYRVAR